MEQPQIPPNKMPVQPQDQDNNDGKPRTFEISDFNWLRIFGLIGLIIIIGIIAKIAITDGSMFISGIANSFANIFERSTLNPFDKSGFENFMKLLLTAGFIGLALYFLKRK